MTIEEELKKQKIEFLMLMDTDPYEWAVDRAYKTLQRNLTGYAALAKELTKSPKEEAKKLLLKNIKAYFEELPQDFDKWHEGLMGLLCDSYKELPAFTYGTAQKWINITFKCLYAITDFSDLLRHPEIKASAFRDCHNPIDSYVIQNAADLKVGNGTDARFYFKAERGWKDETKWSQLRCYKKYLDMQNDLRQFAREFGLLGLDIDAFLWVDPKAKNENGESMREKKLSLFLKCFNDKKSFHYRKKGEKKNH